MKKKIEYETPAEILSQDRKKRTGRWFPNMEQFDKADPGLLRNVLKKYYPAVAKYSVLK